MQRESNGTREIPSEVDPESDIVRLQRRAGRLGTGHATCFHLMSISITQRGSAGYYTDG
jgi:hypothetical protein